MNSLKSPVEHLIQLYEKYGRTKYTEVVTQESHAVQAAYLAEKAGEEKEVILSALLHDLGHLLLQEQKIDELHSPRDHFHEVLGANYLNEFYTDAVVQPVALHVEAKRWLCATDPNYMSTLSAASVRSLDLQGGPFTETELEEFQGNRYWKAAVSLRKWDDQAKDPYFSNYSIVNYKDLLESCLKQKSPF